MQRRSPQDPRGPALNVQPSGFKSLASFLGKSQPGQKSSKGTSRASNEDAAPPSRLPLQYNNNAPLRPTFVDTVPAQNLHVSTAPNSSDTQTSPMLTPRDLDQYPHGQTPSLDSGSWQHPLDKPIAELPPLPPLRSSMLQTAPRPLFNRAETSYHTAPNSIDGAESSHHSSQNSRSTNRSSRSPSRGLRLDQGGRLRDPPMRRTSEAGTGNKLTSFFGWKPSSIRDNATSPTSDFSFTEENALSRPEDGKNADDEASTRSSSPLPFAAPEVIAHVDELLQELRDVSAELASSIRREMELEDEVDKLKIGGHPILMDNNRRTSDYYSDSGSGSTRSSSSNDFKIQGLEKMRRKAEQEKAQLRITMANKMQEDLNQRKALEMHVQSLEEQLSARHVGVYSETPTTSEHDLEARLEEGKRRFNEERRAREELEAQLATIAQEAQSQQNERDNLRDEVVPQLHSRIEGLESETSELQTLVYENTRMQQEIDSLKNENQTLLNARKLQMESQQQRFRSIAEEDGSPSVPASPLMGVPGVSSRARERSSSIAKPKDSNDYTPDRIKDVEYQRDALHQTMKQLVLRLNTQQRDHARQLKAVEAERDKALNGSPRRAAFNVEVKTLRLEVDHLRRRADDALEQKWNCEKGLSGLKMNLDRAQQETSSLRDLLNAYEQQVPGESDSVNADGETDLLEKAYQNLREAHTKSIAQIEDLAKQDEADAEVKSSNLQAAKARLHELRDNVQRQVAANKDLQHRLAEAVNKGEAEQDTNAKKIVELEGALRAAEQKVLTAQAHSEEAVARQEEHVKIVQDTLSQQVRRGLSLQSPARLASPTAPWMGLGLVTSPTTELLFGGAKSPRLDLTSSGRGLSVSEEGKTETLERGVQDLESAASMAEREMQAVVERMNMAQIEVANLQTERDEAMRQTRRLQREMESERLHVQALVS